MTKHHIALDRRRHQFSDAEMRDIVGLHTPPPRMSRHAKRSVGSRASSAGLLGVLVSMAFLWTHLIDLLTF